jgi:hypothetical protein
VIKLKEKLNRENHRKRKDYSNGIFFFKVEYWKVCQVFGKFVKVLPLLNFEPTG